MAILDIFKSKTTKDAQCYVYKWHHKTSYKWYVGSRTAKNCTLNDGYICSNKIVKPLILKNPNDWEKTILAIGSKDEIRLLETEILVLSDAKNDIRSFNKHNQNGKFFCNGHSKETIDKIKKNHAFVGKKRPSHSIVMTGKKRTFEQIEKQRKATIGVKKSIEHIARLKIVKSKGEYITPNGIFLSSRDAALGNDCSKASVLGKCFGYNARGKHYNPKNGWTFKPKAIA
jgi:hypothetical protein